jgi:hypothetical protein
MYKSEPRESFMDLLDERDMMARGGTRAQDKRDFDAVRPAEISPCAPVVMFEDGP